MTMVICKSHGAKGGEQVSKILSNKLRSGHDISRDIRDFSFVIEDLEWPFYGLQEEVAQLPETCVNGDFHIHTDARLNEVLGRITVVCISCLKEAMHGMPLPVKENRP